MALIYKDKEIPFKGKITQNKIRVYGNCHENSQHSALSLAGYT